jgi:hypothetical protein
MDQTPIKPTYNAVDYKALLKKYIDCVEFIHGSDLLGKEWSGFSFTEDEFKTLRELAGYNDD